MLAQPVQQHRWLKKFLGTWQYTSTCSAPDGSGDMTMTGTERVRAIGDLWIQGEGSGTMPGGGVMNTVLTIGYDPAKGRFVGSWVGSMMTHQWVYEGWLENDGRTLVLEAEGPRFDGKPGTTKYRDITEFTSDDHRAFHAEVLGDDGSWSTMMSADYRRAK